MNIKKMSTWLMQITVSSIAILTLISCKMPANPLNVTITNSNNEPTIFDRIFRGSAVSDMINNLSYTNPKGGKIAWLITNEHKIRTLNSDLAASFYEDFKTRSNDVSFTRLDILNSISNTKLKFANKEVRVLDGMNLKEATNIKVAINFNLYFKGQLNYILTGTAAWNYNITKIAKDKDENFVLLWKHEINDSSIDITNLTRN